MLSFHESNSNIFCCLLLEIFDLIHHINLLLLCCIVFVVHPFCNYNWLGSSDNTFVSFFWCYDFMILLHCCFWCSHFMCQIQTFLFCVARDCYVIVLLCCFCLVIGHSACETSVSLFLVFSFGVWCVFDLVLLHFLSLFCLFIVWMCCFGSSSYCIG